MFVSTNDEELRNQLRNLGTVPIFFFRKEVSIMDTPTEAFTEKMKLKEQSSHQVYHFGKWLNYKYDNFILFNQFTMKFIITCGLN